MSRSNPNSNNPHPAKAWFEYGGGDGIIKYYDKERQEVVEVGEKMTFIYLDHTGTVKGFKKSTGSIFSNEVRDTRAQPFIVKSKNAGVIAEGVWKEIKDKVTVRGGKFTTNLYIAYRAGESSLELGVLQLKGAALNAWVEFQKEHRNEINSKAVKINGSTDRESGGINFKSPVFEIAELSEETNAQAIALDKKLQEHFKAYFSRPSADRATHAQEQEQEPTRAQGEPLEGDGPPESDDVPF